MPDAPAHSLPTRFGPFAVRHYASLGSTSTHARQLLGKNDLAVPGVVVTDRQTAGRGRHGRSWQSDGAALTATFCLGWDPDSADGTLGQRAGVAVRQAVGCFVPRCGLKWPNDLLIDDRKVAGLLVERLVDVVLIGIGINLTAAPAMTGLAVRPTAVADHVRGEVPARDLVLHELARALETWFMTSPPAVAEVIRAWNHHDALTGRPVVVTQIPGREGELRGVGAGIDDQGRLLVRGDGLHAVNDGRVRLA